MYYFPKENEVSLGENNRRIIYLTKTNEVSVINDFKQCGGQVFNPMYYPPERKEIVQYSQSNKAYSHFRRMISSISSLMGSLKKMPLSKEYSAETVSLSNCSFNSTGTKMAVCFPDSRVRIYSMEKQQWKETVLYDEKQIGIHSICWKPDSHNTLAISCLNGVYIWSFSDCAYYRVITEQSAILSSQFSPCGLYMAVIRKDDPSVYIYHTADYKLLNVLSLNAFPKKVAFSNDSCILTVLSTDGSLTIFNTLSWKQELWRIANGVDFAFSANSEFIYVCCDVNNKSVLFTLQVSHFFNEMYSSMNSSTIVLVEDNSGLGKVNQIQVDPHGCRLICCHSQSNILSVFSIQNSTSFSSLGYLNNPIMDNEPKEVAFIPGEKKGSILCVTWKSGHVLFYHLLY